MKLNLEYTFEDMFDGDYQVRLCGEFVCYCNHTDEKGVDKALKQMGFETREDYLSHRLKQYGK